MENTNKGTFTRIQELMSEIERDKDKQDKLMGSADDIKGLLNKITTDELKDAQNIITREFLNRKENMSESGEWVPT